MTTARAQIHNAFDEAMIADLDAAFARAGEDDTVRVIVLAGQGKSFSAGADLARPEALALEIAKCDAALR